MKTPEQYIKDAINKLHDSDKPWFADNVYDGGSGPIIEAIKQAQVDAIEETCKVCAENASIDLYDFIGSSFKKFEQDNHYVINDASYIEISKASILNCAGILKKETE